MAHSTIKEAQRLAQRGEYMDSGDLYRSAGEFEKALDMYLKVRAYHRSAPLLEWLGRNKEAARHFAKAGQYAKSAEMFKEIKDYYQAGMMYKEAGVPLLAAEMYLLAEATSDAATMLEEAQDFIRAGQLYFDRGMFSKVISCFERILENPYYDNKTFSTGRLIKEELAMQTARAYEQLRKYSTAADLFFKAGAIDDAVRVSRIVGDLARAARFLESVNRWDEASAIYNELGEINKARFLQIQKLLSENEYSKAAILADDSGEFKIAAEAYELSGEFAKAGEMYRLTERPRKAAEMFMQAGRIIDAAMLFEQLGDTNQAAELREELGEYDKAADLYALANEPFKAGQLFLQLNNLDMAIQVLQNAWSQGDRAISIRNLLGLAFLRRGNFDLGYDNYLKYLIEEDVSPHNIDVFYELGCGFEARGQPERAVKVFERISAFDLSYRQVKEKLATLAHISKDAKSRPTTTFPHQFSPGAIVAERYVIRERVGAGGMGVVYRAFDQELSNEVALKVLKPKYSNDSEMIHRFKQEVNLARKIHHDNVIQLYDFEKVNNLLYISMEFFPSRDLKAMIRTEQTFNIDTIIQVMAQVCSGLWSAHRIGIVHRDIKPQNILINDTGIVKLVDFGIAMVIGLSKDSDSDFVVGTPEYMSPEQAKGETTDTRSDIYSLGTILYEACVGVPPFTSPDSFKVLVDQVETLPIPPINRNPSLPRWMNDLVMRCLEKRPDDRYETVLEIERQLATCGLADLMLHSDADDDDD